MLLWVAALHCIVTAFPWRDLCSERARSAPTAEWDLSPRVLGAGNHPGRGVAKPVGFCLQPKTSVDSFSSAEVKPSARAAWQIYGEISVKLIQQQNSSCAAKPGWRSQEVRSQLCAPGKHTCRSPALMEKAQKKQRRNVRPGNNTNFG